MATDSSASTMNDTAVSPLRVGALVFLGFQSLDLFGPLDIFNTMSLKHPIELSVISTSLDPVSTQVKAGQVSQSIVPTHTFENAPTELDLLIVPGGSGTKLDVDAHVDYIRRAYPTIGSVLSVCTGTRLFARAGILDGRRATTNKNAFNEVTPLGPKTYWVAKARWVKDGNVWTAAGITAGIDATLAWVEDKYGAQQATDAANWLEYKRTADPEDDPFAALREIQDVPPTE